jgi:hypothetical protein
MEVYKRGDMGKPWSEMTPAERMADRIAKNREIDQRVSEKLLLEPKKKPGAASREVASRTKAVRNVLDKFQEIKKTQGMDAAAEFVRARKA